jgi:hypothetical protein
MLAARQEGPVDIETELRQATDGWRIDRVARHYVNDTAGHALLEAEGRILAEHGYGPVGFVGTAGGSLEDRLATRARLLGGFGLLFESRRTGSLVVVDFERASGAGRSASE